jgi:hypothetical protein
MHASELQTIKSQRGNHATRGSAVPDLFISGVTFPDFKHRSKIAEEGRIDAGLAAQMPMIVFIDRTHLETLAAVTAAVVGEYGTDPLLNHIDQPDFLLRTDVCTCATSEAKPPFRDIFDCVYVDKHRFVNSATAVDRPRGQN